MKKLIVLFSSICILSSTVYALEDNMFSSLENLSPVQKNQLKRIYQEYKIKNNSLETRIMEYTSKLNQLKEDTEKTPEQLSVLAGAYERNLNTYKAQQKKLEQETDLEYQKILTAEQYEQYKKQQSEVQDAFKQFLPK